MPGSLLDCKNQCPEAPEKGRREGAVTPRGPVATARVCPLVSQALGGNIEPGKSAVGAFSEGKAEERTLLLHPSR